MVAFADYDNDAARPLRHPAAPMPLPNKGDDVRGRTHKAGLTAISTGPPPAWADLDGDAIGISNVCHYSLSIRPTQTLRHPNTRPPRLRSARLSGLAGSRLPSTTAAVRRLDGESGFIIR